MKDFTKTNIYKKIIREKIPCYFVSPHLDDAALSAGALMIDLSSKTKVTVINLFTKGGNSNTLSAKKTLISRGFRNSNKYYGMRVKEDANALKSINVKVVNLDFSEALWRTKKSTNFLERSLAKLFPEFVHLYPVYFLNISNGKIAPKDKENYIRITSLLHKIVPEKALVFGPLAVGNHVDHIIAKKSMRDFKNKIFWFDQPYLLRTINGNESRNLNNKQIYVYKNGMDQKIRFLNKYKTEIKNLFYKSSIPPLEEKYLITKQYE